MELLAPAGHWDAMAAAVQNGADAVYLGCGAWNARRSAKNFSDEELPEAVRYCHLRGVKVYLTLNTLLSDRELPQAADALRRASRCGVDAVIVQDWGLAALARQIVPDLPLHGSTQMTVHSLAGVEAAAALGIRCVVLGRELDRENIRLICENSPVPIEIFGHGALCMCWSGQCAMSALIGGRSGNRGLCAQPCRLPYRMDSEKMGRPLSLKDSCLAGHIPELMDMGVSILKLEGRMKRAEYVAVVTRIYAGLIREKRTPTSDEMQQLTLAFSRDGFTDGYWQGKTGPHMFGFRPENAAEPSELFRDARNSYTQGERRTVPVTVSAVVLADRPASLTVNDAEGHSVCAEGPVPEPARTRPLTEDDLRVRLNKMGGTVFRASEIFVTMDNGLSLSASAVNSLRRAALDWLSALRSEPSQRRELPDPQPVEASTGSPELALTVSLSSGRQLTSALLELEPDITYFPVERVEEFDLSSRSTTFCAVLPRVCTDSELPALAALLQQVRKKGCTSAAVQNIGQLKIAEDFILRGGFALNIFNSRSLQEIKSWGLTSAALSCELRYQQIRDLCKPLPCEAVIYGRLPLMLTENCLISNALTCRDKNRSCGSLHSLTDRRGEVFPVLSVFGCRSEIENSQIMYLADKPDYLRCGLAYGCLRFTTESPEECAAVLRAYREGGCKPKVFTRGLFYRGVE